MIKRMRAEGGPGNFWDPGSGQILEIEGIWRVSPRGARISAGLVRSQPVWADLNPVTPTGAAGGIRSLSGA